MKRRISSLLCGCLLTGLLASGSVWAQDGSIVAWGLNESGQCDAPAPNEGFVAVDGGGVHSLGLKTDGTIVAWGGNSWGQTAVPEPPTDFVALSAGGNHSLGLKADGSIVAWGRNDAGQCIVPLPNDGFVTVEGAGDASLGLKADGSIVAWGSNSYGQLNVPLPNTDFVSVAARGFHCLGLKADGSIVAWGDNTYGQLDVPPLNSDFVVIAAGTFHGLGIKSPPVTGIDAGEAHSLSSIIVVAPNPLVSGALVTFLAASASPASVIVVDSTGRLIRRFHVGSSGGGVSRVWWDGTDQSGHLVGSGPYFVRTITDGKPSVPGKVIVLR